MKARFGIDFHENKRGKTQYIEWDSRTAVNPHMLFVGMSGAGKTHNLKKLIRSMTDTVALDRDLRVHVFDVHGDIEIDGASTVMFSQQTDYGFNPLRVNPDPHFGGPERQIQGLFDTLDKVMRKLGNKQEACLRNILMDLYTAHGFEQKKLRRGALTRKNRSASETARIGSISTSPGGKKTRPRPSQMYAGMVSCTAGTSLRTSTWERSRAGR